MICLFLCLIAFGRSSFFATCKFFHLALKFPLNNYFYIFRSNFDNLRAGERKFFLTPLVTFLEDPQSGIDVDEAVSRMLSPLRRKVFLTSVAVSSGKESLNSYSTEIVPAMQPMEGIESEEMSSNELTFRLCTTDDRGFRCSPIFKDSPVKFSRITKVLLDWTDREQELYDSSYLKDLPEVHKTGLTVKKTKQEAISLFSCLDAFLKEEPLGPDDMW